MEVHNKPIILPLIPCLLFIFFFVLPLPLHPSPPVVGCQLLPIVGDGDEMKTYIVHVEEPGEGADLLGRDDLEAYYRSFLPSAATLGSGGELEPRLVYSYRHAISGFAARLTPEEVEDMEGILHAQPEQTAHPLTTYTPQLLGLSGQPQTGGGGVWATTSTGEGVIIGVIDTGIAPNHPSFAESDSDALPQPPSKWRGSCFSGFQCNNKLIGAIASKTDLSPEDESWTSHGTHVASIAAGASVEGAELWGMASGTASGMAPRAHLAVYKPAPSANYTDADILVCIDQAIADGVDVINLSLTSGYNIPFHRNHIAIGTLSAVRKGIIVVAGAGNEGPDPETLGNSAPWFLSVGATSTDRRIRSVVRLGNGVEFQGESMYQPGALSPTPMRSIAYPGENGNSTLRYCDGLGSLRNVDVRGKVVLCWVKKLDNPLWKAQEVEEAGGVGVILMNEDILGYTTTVEARYLPVSRLNFMDGRSVRDYYYTSKAPTASIIFEGTQFGYRPSPGLAFFSSRGPSKVNGGVLKPDVLAPGVNILAAVRLPLIDRDTNMPSHPNRSFGFQSGTSMAAPHVSGIAALIRSTHWGWSPAAIQSAIVTSADELDLDGNIIVDESSGLPADIFQMGAGQVNASRALDPGLVYDFNPDNYGAYLCSLGYTDNQVQIVARRPRHDHIKCSDVTHIDAKHLNYPSITWHVTPGATTATINRTVTNVGEPGSTYRARISEPDRVQIRVSPHELRFTARQQTATFEVTLRVRAANSTLSSTSRGKLQWVSDRRVVTSPIAILHRQIQDT